MNELTTRLRWGRRLLWGAAGPYLLRGPSGQQGGAQSQGILEKASLSCVRGEGGSGAVTQET